MLLAPHTLPQIAMIFSPEIAPPVLGWSSAIASFGAFLIPKFFGIAIQGGTPEAPFFALAFVCWGVTINLPPICIRKSFQ